MSVFDGKWTWNGSGSSVVNGLLQYADRKRVRSSSGGTADVRRERGTSWFTRQRAQPVDLPHPLLHEGLRFGEVGLVCGCARSGKSELAYLIASGHAVGKGGRVVWVTAPGAKSVQPRRLAAYLEREVRFQHLAAPIDDAAQLEATILQAAARMEVIACDTVEEFEEVPRRLATIHATPSGTQPGAGGGGLSCAASKSNGVEIANKGSGAESPPTPLLIVEGLGATSWMGLRERICSDSCSLRSWVLQAISALSCAVIILDATYDAHGKVGGHGAAVNWGVQDTDDVIYNCYTFKALGAGAPSSAMFRSSRVSCGGVNASAQLVGESAVLTAPRPASSLLPVPPPTALTLKFVLFTAACRGPACAGGGGCREQPSALPHTGAVPSLPSTGVHRHLLFMFRCDSSEPRGTSSGNSANHNNHTTRASGNAPSRCTVVPLGVAEYFVDAQGASLHTTV